MDKNYTSIIKELKQRDTYPRKHMFDNKMSERCEQVTKELGLECELVPPDVHRRNLTEKAMQVWKDHMISILCGVDKSFPLNQWDRLLLHAVKMLNMLRKTNADPKVSTHACMCRPHNYNSQPLAPMGCVMQMYVEPGKSKTWDPHSVDSWYIATSTEHCRSHVILKKETTAEVASDTEIFKHKHVTNPTVTPEDQVVQAVRDLTKAIKENTLSQKGETTLQ